MASEPNAGVGLTSVGDSLVGKEIDGCTIVKKIGQGGMGIVYLAEHTKLRQQYVVKILNPALTAAEDTVQRFFREAQSVARLNHPSIVSIQNVGQDGDYYYIRMEYVDGDTVENIVKEQKKLDWKLATKVVLDTAEALSHAHKKGIIHRDIKPENIMLTKAGEVKVMDFGLAKQVQAATKVSVTGQIVGTPFFMSPEQAGGKTTDARSDIYSLGVTYYYLLTGVKPFNGKNLQEIFLKHFFYTPESPKIYTPGLPENVCEVIRRCLKKKKKERYQSAAQLAKDLNVVLGLEAGTLSSSPDGAGAVPEGDDQAPPPLPVSEEASRTTVAGGAGGLDGGRTAAASVGPAGGVALDLPVSAQPPPPLITSASGVFAQSPFAPPADGPSLQQDLAAAQAELGADAEPQTIVSGSDASRVAEAPPPEAPASEAGEGDAAAPLQRRGGRVALDEVAGASLVFQARSGPVEPAVEAPAEPLEPATVTGEEAPALNHDATGKFVAPVIPNVPVGDGSSTVRIDATAGVKTPDAAVKPPPRSRAKTLVLAGVAVAVLAVVGGGAYQAMASGALGELEARYAQLRKGLPTGASDARPWEDAARAFLALADDADGFASTSYRFSLKKKAAEALAQKCRQDAQNAEAAAGEFRKLPTSAAGPSVRDKQVKEFQAALGRIDDLVAQKKYEEAGREATKTHEQFARVLGDTYAAQIRCPIAITSDPPGAKVYLAQDPNPRGETSASPGKPCIVLVQPFKAYTIEVRLPKFKPVQVATEIVTGFKSYETTLEREVLRRFPVGITRTFTRFKGNVSESVGVDAVAAIDPQGPSQAATLALVGRDGSLRCLELRSGRNVWLAPNGQPVGEYGDAAPGPDVLPGKAIGTVSCDGTVRVHAVDTGVALWARNVGSPVTAPPRFSADATSICVGTVTGSIVLLDAVTGQIRWQRSTEGPIATSPVFQGPKVFVGCLDDRLRRIDVASGKVEAVYDAREAICAGPVLCGNLLYVGTREGRVHALSATNLQLVFVTAPAGAPITLIAPTPDAVFFTTRGEIRAVSPTANGTQLFEPYRPGLNVAGVVPMRDRIALVSTTGTVMALDQKTGLPAWYFELRSSKGAEVTVTAPPLYHNDELFVVTSEGEVVVLSGD